MSKLHELLAVDTDVMGQADKCRKELAETFEKKSHHFTKKILTVTPVKDGEPSKTEQQLELQTTVADELKWVSEKLTAALDVGHQVDVANTTAVANIVLDDETILLEDVPTTSLLRMTHRVTEIRDLVYAIKTLDPAKGFELDPKERPGVYKAKDAHTFRGEKVFDYVVMVAPTDKFPAQVKELMIDKKTHDLLTQEWSSLITVKAKGEMLDRVEEILRALKKARARANELEIDTRVNKIGAKVLNYVFSGVKISSGPSARAVSD